MECKRYEKLMVDLLAGELTKAETEMLMTHLKKCPGCAELFEEYKIVIEKSKSIKISVPDDYVWEQRLVEIKGLQRRPIHILKPVSVFATLLLIFSLIFVKVINNEKTIVRIPNKNGYEILLTKLPYPEDIILDRIEYIDEDAASEILSIILNTPTFPIYEY